MQPLLRIAKICLILSASTLGACASMNELQKTNSATPVKFNQIPSVDRTIVRDLAAVISQIYDPLSTTLQVNSIDTDETLNHFVTVLAKKGFGIQRVSADQGANFVSYSRSKEKLNNQPHVNFSVSVGAVSIARKYQLMADNSVSPASTVRLSGTRAPVAVNDAASRNIKVSDPSLSTVVYVSTLDLDSQAPMISLITPEIVSSIAGQGAGQTSLQALNSNKVEVNNLFYAEQSTFASVLEDYSKIYKYVVVFGNDSMVLGNSNKSIIDQLVENVVREDDIVSLVGCSNGPTALEIGNEGLALGRASRVTEALMSRGISRENILDEGCWAPVLEEQDRFPNRGVVLELWRKNA